jgi:hypothetical protein
VRLATLNAPITERPVVPAMTCPTDPRSANPAGPSFRYGRVFAGVVRTGGGKARSGRQSPSLVAGVFDMPLAGRPPLQGAVAVHPLAVEPGDPHPGGPLVRRVGSVDLPTARRARIRQWRPLLPHAEHRRRRHDGRPSGDRSRTRQRPRWSIVGSPKIRAVTPTPRHPLIRITCRSARSHGTKLLRNPCHFG